MKTLLQQIQAAFADADAQSIAALPEKVIEARAAYRNLKKEYLATQYGSYERRIASNAIDAMFTKSFQSEYSWGEEDHIERAIKALKKAHAARNDRIHNKMAKAGITSIDVDNFKVIYGEDFQGLWVVGGHVVEIRVIWAGGYNIQSLHQRVLVKVTENKEAA